MWEAFSRATCSLWLGVSHDSCLGFWFSSPLSKAPVWVWAVSRTLERLPDCDPVVGGAAEVHPEPTAVELAHLCSTDVHGRFRILSRGVHLHPALCQERFIPKLSGCHGKTTFYMHGLWGFMLMIVTSIATVSSCFKFYIYGACKISADRVAKASQSVVKALNITVSQMSTVGISPWEDTKK